MNQPGQPCAETSRYNRAMEEQDDQLPQDEQAIRDRIDDELVNHDLMEQLDAATRSPVCAS
jgi:hypothetical protein